MPSETSNRAIEQPGSLRQDVLVLLAILLAQTPLLATAAWSNRDLFNPDAVAYLRLAGYWAGGDWNLAVTGYWGPAFCWLVALCRVGSDDPALAGRAAMAVSAAAFTISCWHVARRMGLRGGWLAAVVAVAAARAIGWSIHGICPDLLLSAALNSALATLLSRLWTIGGRRACGAGLWLGAAYLVKAVALPLGVLMTALCLAVGWATRSAAAPQLARAAGLTLACAGVVAAPWMVALSLKYGRPTFSTTAAIAHAIVGPETAKGEHPVLATFHEVEPGRVTSWEDPSRMPYRYWSPWDSRRALRHQAQLVRENVLVWARWCARFDAWRLGLLPLLVWWWPRRGAAAAVDWRWAAALAGAVGMIYAPVYANLSRYYFPLYAWLFCGTLLAAGVVLRTLLSHQATSFARWLPRAGMAVVWLSFAWTAVDGAARALESHSLPEFRTARFVAQRLRETAGVTALAGGQTVGMYVGLLTDTPWLGDDPAATADEAQLTGASHLIVTDGAARLREDLAADGRFVRLDAAWEWPDEIPASQRAAVFQRR